MSTVAPSQVGPDFVKFNLGTSQLFVSLNTTTQVLEFIATVPQNNYFAIGFGPTMFNTDMFVWTAKQASSTTINMWSTNDSSDPRANPLQTYHNSTFVQNTNNTVSFSTKRKMNTGYSKNYVVANDTTITMCYAISITNNPTFQQHKSYGVFALRFATPDPVTGKSAVVADVFEVAQPNQLAFDHGAWMFASWCVLGWLMLATKRYMKRQWLISQILHSLIGTFILIVTYIYSLKMLQPDDYVVREVNPHYFFGLFVWAIVSVVWVSGVAGAVLGTSRIDLKQWAFHKQLHTRILSFHAWLGRFNLLMGYIACMFGIWLYYRQFKEGERGLGNLCIILTVLLTFFSEVIFQIWRFYSKNELKLDHSLPQITVQEFKTRVHQNNEKLMVMDNCVLQMNMFENFHPGGVFTMQKNYGRDVTKYFNGAYKLVQVTDEWQQVHSVEARSIANNLVIANIQGQALILPYECYIVQKQEVNKCGTCFKLQTVNGFVVNNWKRWYDDLSMIGRHYLISSKRFPEVKRQYTVCSSVVPPIYSELLNLGSAALKGESVSFDKKIVSTSDSNTLHVTCKDYKTQKGVASQMHAQQLNQLGDIYYVKGPMGLGLDVDENGHNIVFCGGTGILVFLDLVAKLLLQLALGSDKTFGETFKLTLYFTAPSEAEAIGIELCKLLQDLQSKKGGDSFILKVRLGDSKEKQARWDKDFILSELTPLSGHISRVYVCGAPAMNQTFDQAFEQIGSILQIAQQNIQIL